MTYIDQPGINVELYNNVTGSQGYEFQKSSYSDRVTQTLIAKKKFHLICSMKVIFLRQRSLIKRRSESPWQQLLTSRADERKYDFLHAKYS